MSGVLQILGALCVLVPFVAAQLGRMRIGSASYLSLNLVGSALLALLALLSGQWGFLLLEGCWAAVSARSLARRERTDGA